MISLLGKTIILVVASEGYQPIEYQIPKRILEEAGIKVLTASNKPGGAVASDKSTTPVDLVLGKFDIADYDGIFFIGGSGALTHLDNSTSYYVINEAKRLGIPYGAICISPRILAKADALRGLKATGWDEDNALNTILTGHGAIYDRKPIVTDGIVVTASGPKSAEEFAQGIIRVLTKKELGPH